MRPIIAVSGFGRCGSSMVMQMLAAGGMRATGDYPTYEAYEMTDRRQHHRRRFLIKHEGQAVKILDPHRADMAPPIGIDYRVIWLDRNRTQQARSFLKFAALALDIGSVDVTDQTAIARIAVGYSQDRGKALRAWQTLTPHMLHLTFEDLLSQPAMCAKLIAAFAFVDSQPMPASVDAMAAVVRTRSPDCYRGLLEAELMLEADARRQADFAQREAL